MKKIRGFLERYGIAAMIGDGVPVHHSSPSLARCGYRNSRDRSIVAPAKVASSESVARTRIDKFFVNATVSCAIDPLSFTAEVFKLQFDDPCVVEVSSKVVAANLFCRAYCRVLGREISIELVWAQPKSIKKAIVTCS